MSETIGIEFNTFSIVGRCARTGMLGVAITTSDLAVGSRCPFVLPGVGAVSTQAMTDPRFGPKALGILKEGSSPQKALEIIQTQDPHIERRQIGIVSGGGTSVARTGAMNKPWAGHIAKENFIAMGNGLSSQQVVGAMAETFETTASQNLEDRLLMAIEAGQEAGGEAQDMTPYHSAALLIYGEQAFPRVDLRVDEHTTAIIELRRIFDLYKPNIDYFNLRAIDPEKAMQSRTIK